MTTRRWMIAAGIVAVTLAAWRCMERRAYYLGRVKAAALLEQRYSHRRNVMLSTGEYLINESFFDADGNMKPNFATILDQWHAYYAGLVRKYRYAASHPWLAVEPDLPPPD